MENLKEFVFLLNEKEYIIILKIENDKIVIKSSEREKDLPFEYSISLTLEEFKKIINLFDNLDEVKIFLENVLIKKENISAQIDEDEENITLFICYYITNLKKNFKLNLTRNILSDKKMIEYLINENKYLKKLIKSKGISLDSKEDKSELITNENQINLIKSGINNLNSKKLKLNLIYKASRDGDSPEIFHLKCNNKSPTISIFKTTDNNIFGGYTDNNWDNYSKDLKCNNTFLFSFDYMKIYPGKNGGMIFCDKDIGPWFSYALGAKQNHFLKEEQDVPFNINEFKQHWNNFEKEYELTGGKKKYRLKEIEVFYVEFI